MLAIWLSFQEIRRDRLICPKLYWLQSIKILLKKKKKLFFFTLQVSSYDLWPAFSEEEAVLSKESIYILTVITLIAL